MRKTRRRQHDRKCRLKSSQAKSIYFNHPSQGNYYLILGHRDKAAPPTTQQINKFPPKRVKNLATPSSIFIFISSSSTGELCSQPIKAVFVEYGECSQNMLSEAFWTPNIASSQFEEYSQLGLRRKVCPIKNQLGLLNTSK